MKSSLQHRLRAEMIPLGICLLLASLTLVPYLVGWLKTPDGYVFSHVILPFSEDPETYLAKILSAVEGWQYTNLYSPEPLPAVYLFLFHAFLGKVATLLSLSPIAVLHLARFSAGFLVFYSLWQFSGVFFEARDRWFFFGAGTVFSPIPFVPYLGIELAPFLSALYNPHFSLSMACFLACCVFFHRFILTGRSLYLMVMTVAALLISIIHPYILAPLGFLYLAVAWSHAKRYFSVVLAGMTMVPGGLYALYLYMAMQHPVLRFWQLQSHQQFLSIDHYLIHMGLVLPLGLAGAVLLASSRDRRQIALAGFVGVVLALTLVPVSFNLRMTEALAGIMGGIGGVFLFQAWKTSKPVVRVTSLSLALVMVLSFFVNLVPKVPFDTAYYSRDEVAAYQWLADIPPRQSILVLPTASEAKGIMQLGNRCPGRSGQRVYVGHYAETIDVEGKLMDARRFYNAQSQEQESFLYREGITHVLKDRDGWVPPPCLKLCYRNSTMEIYKVVPLNPR